MRRLLLRPFLAASAPARRRCQQPCPAFPDAVRSGARYTSRSLLLPPCFTIPSDPVHDAQLPQSPLQAALIHRCRRNHHWGRMGVVRKGSRRPPQHTPSATPFSCRRRSVSASFLPQPPRVSVSCSHCPECRHPTACLPFPHRSVTPKPDAPGAHRPSRLKRADRAYSLVCEGCFGGAVPDAGCCWTAGMFWFLRVQSKLWSYA